MANAIVLSGFLPPQHFTGIPLDRHSDLLKRFQATYNPDSEVSLIVVTGRDVVVRPVGPDSTPGVHQDLQALLLRTDDPELDLQGEQLLLKWTPSECICSSSRCSIQQPSYFPAVSVIRGLSGRRQVFNGHRSRLLAASMHSWLPFCTTDTAEVICLHCSHSQLQLLSLQLYMDCSLLYAYNVEHQL
eukprot:GHRQ01022869.1.p1 GENE.GHRQ01022869.1~~GHRQ01022869.1.p1  ORF type:complete len:187 (+),score=21.47 GHRQ01022869.1:67-627(+)